MTVYFKYDSSTGEYLGPIIVEGNEDIPNSCTDKELPQPNWKPVFQNGNWIETATEEEKNPTQNDNPLSLEKLAQQQVLIQKALDDLILGGAL